MEQSHNKPKLTPTPSQDVSLRKYFHGTHAEREEVISIHPPEMQDKMRTLAKSLSNLDKLFGILYSDLKYASGQMKAHTGDHSCEQFWRRTTIRTLAATVDGMIFCFKQNALAVGSFLEYQFKDEESFLLSEVATEATRQKKLRLPSFRDNLKQTFKLFSKINNIPCPVDFSQRGFECLCEIYELRSELMHPKSFWDFHVSDNQKQKAADAILWLGGEGRKLFDSCSPSQ